MTPSSCETSSRTSSRLRVRGRRRGGESARGHPEIQGAPARLDDDGSGDAFQERNRGHSRNPQVRKQSSGGGGGPFAASDELSARLGERLVSLTGKKPAPTRVIVERPPGCEHTCAVPDTCSLLRGAARARPLCEPREPSASEGTETARARKPSPGATRITPTAPDMSPPATYALRGWARGRGPPLPRRRNRLHEEAELRCRDDLDGSSSVRARCGRGPPGTAGETAVAGIRRRDNAVEPTSRVEERSTLTNRAERTKKGTFSLEQVGRPRCHKAQRLRKETVNIYDWRPHLRIHGKLG
jgi:hypothetical protein